MQRYIIPSQLIGNHVAIYLVGATERRGPYQLLMDGVSWLGAIQGGGNLLSASRQLAPSRFSLVWVCRHCSQFKTDELSKWGTIYVLKGWHRCVFNKQLCCLTLLKLDHLLVYWVKVRSFVFICILFVCLHEDDVRNRLGSLFSPTAACDGLSSLSPSGSLVTHPPNRVKDK